MRERGRVKVWCCNWGHADAPKAVSGVLVNLADEFGQYVALRAEKFHDTWQEAIDRANELARLLQEQS